MITWQSNNSNIFRKHFVLMLSYIFETFSHDYFLLEITCGKDNIYHIPIPSHKFDTFLLK